MDDLIDMMIADESPADISDKIKELLVQKSAENIDIIRPVVASSMFGGPELGGETPEVVGDDGGEDEE
jgi:hypothetical protein